MDREAQKLVHIADADKEKKEPYMIKLKGESVLGDFKLFHDQTSSVAGEDKPILVDVGYDTIENLYPRDEMILKRIVSEDSTVTRARGDVMLAHCRSDQKILAPCKDISDVHFKVLMIDGCLCICGLKPYTQIFHLDADVSKGYPMIETTPIE